MALRSKSGENFVSCCEQQRLRVLYKLASSNLLQSPRLAVF